jgi:hypothetical protein
VSDVEDAGITAGEHGRHDLGLREVWTRASTLGAAPASLPLPWRVTAKLLQKIPGAYGFW